MVKYRSGILIKHVDQGVLVDRSGMAPDNMAILKHDETGYRGNAVGLGYLHILIYIYFHYPGLPFHQLGYLLDHRAHGLAGSAPIGIKINQYRLFGLDELFKCFHRKLIYKEYPNSS